MIRQLFLAGVLACAGIATMVVAAQDPELQDQADAELTAEERDTAAAIARRALEQRGLVATGPLYLSRVELLRDKAGEVRAEPVRQALVTHYRYLGDLTILTAVDLPRQAVISLDTVSGVVAPLAREEFEQARKLALADPRVRRTLDREADRVTVEALLTRSADPRDPLFRHRVVRLLFRVRRDYLSAPLVIVDLSAGTVVIEPAGR